MVSFEGLYTIYITHYVAASIWQMHAVGPHAPYQGQTLEVQNEFLSSAFSDNSVFFNEADAIANALNMIEKTKASSYQITEV